MIVLTESAIVARTVKVGSEMFDMESGQGLKIKLTGPANTVLDVDVPQGKAWRVCVNVDITETGA